jgi:predicted RecB family nuclease
MTERLLTPSKITAFLECEHYLTLANRLELGQLRVRNGFGSMAHMLMAKGLEHEQACLEHYRTQGKSVFEVPKKHDNESFAAWVGRVGNPMADGYDVIYQMPFVHEGIRGVADFIERVVDSDTGFVRYEPVDAKLARAAAKPGHVLQLCFYADAIEATTGVTPVDVHIWLGSGRVEHIRLDNVRAYWRRIRYQLATVLELDPAASETVPEKCNHCQFCEFADACETQWRDEDSLLFVANILKADRVALVANGRSTMASLAVCDEAIDGIRPERQVRLVQQAKLQVLARLGAAGPLPTSLLDDGTPEALTGFRAMPRQDDGDVFLDYEGHPFWRADTGLFFLFGLLTRVDDGSWTYDARWAHDQAGEASITKQLIADLAARRQRYPSMHVYHYNHTERSSLERLAEIHGVGEATLQHLVETGLFVDLLSVVRGAIQVGVESYGLKYIERLTGFERSHDIDQGAGAVVEYEAYSHDHDRTRLDKIARYNQDDVQATMELRDWLVRQRPAECAWRAAVIDIPENTYPDIDNQVESLHAFPVDSPEHLLGDLLGYWLRESRAVFGNMVAKTAYELAAQLDEPEMLGGLTSFAVVPREGKRGQPILPVASMQMPRQEVGRKLVEGSDVVFRGGDEVIGFSKIARIDADAGVVDLVWNQRCEELDVKPTCVVLNDWVGPGPKPAALSEFAGKLLSADPSDPPSAAATAILRREPPRFVTGGGPAGGRFTDRLDDMKKWIHRLDHSYVAIQGPPGTGKTYTGAHLIHTLITEGHKRVGITAMSHEAINNLLNEVVKVFTGAGDIDKLHAVCKVKAKRESACAAVTFVTENAPCLKAEYNLVGGTTWLFSREDMRTKPLDVLIVDEAGQLSLADTLASAGAAHNVVLLGDPLQLANVTQGSHPGGSAASVLEHVLGEGTTIHADRGVFLAETWRMHPDVCEFISDQIYEGRLTSHPSCALQNTGAGTGLRWLEAYHAKCSTESQVEASIVVDEIARLIGQPWTDATGVTTRLTTNDFMVVAPYNDQVAMLGRQLDDDPRTAGVRVGTVDKFQGQEAPVVFFTMTASTASDIPRGVDFLFSKNRLNVAISRARALAFLVCTEELLNSRARTVGDMELIAALCSFVERCAANPPSTGLLPAA